MEKEVVNWIMKYNQFGTLSKAEIHLVKSFLELQDVRWNKA